MARKILANDQNANKGNGFEGAGRDYESGRATELEKDVSEMSEVDEGGSAEKTGGTRPSETVRIACGVGLDHQPLENTPQDPSRQSRALWVMAEVVVHLPKVFFVLQSHGLDHFLSTRMDLKSIIRSSRRDVDGQGNPTRPSENFTVHRECSDELEIEVSHCSSMLHPHLRKMEDTVVHVVGGEAELFSYIAYRVLYMVTYIRPSDARCDARRPKTVRAPITSIRLVPADASTGIRQVRYARLLLLQIPHISSRDQWSARNSSKPSKPATLTIGASGPEDATTTRMS